MPAISSSGSGVVSAIAYSGSGNNLVLSVTKTAVVTSLGTKTGAITLSGGLSIDSNNVLSSTDNKVTQTATTTSSAYELLFSATADNTTRTEGARKTSTLTYNPSTKALSTGGAVNGLTLSSQTTGFKISGGTTSKTLTVGADYTLAAACAKAVVTSVDTSASLPTSKAVKDFVEGKGYVTSSGVTSITLTSGTGITVSNSGTAITSTGSRTISLNVAGAKTALGLGTMAYETASNYLTTTTAASTYVKLSPGTSEQTISSSISSLAKGVINLWRSSGDHYTFLGFSNGTTETYLGGIGFKSQSDHNLYRKDGSSYYTIFDENNYTSYVNTTNFPGLNKTGTVTKVSTGTGLTGGDITTTGTISINSTYQSYITHGESAYNSLGNYVLKAGDTMTGGLAICLTPSSSYPVDRTKATLIVEDDSEAATGEVRGGSIIISRGYTATVNQSAGAISFYSRRLSGGYRNGARIASIASAVGNTYDRQDLVFYASNNTSDSTPAFEEAMRIRADKAVSMNGWLSVSRGDVYNIYTNNTASGGTASGIRFQLNGTTKGGLFVSSDKNLYYSAGTSSTGSKVLTASNYDGYALPLAGGTMTGSIKLTNGTYINAASGYAMCGIGSGGDTFYCGPGAEISSAFYLRSGNINLTHVKAGTNYTIWDGSNAGTSTTPWTCSTLTTNGSITMYESSSHTYRWTLNFNSAVGRLYAINNAGTVYNDILINNTITVTSGYNVGIGTASPSYKLHVSGTTGFASGHLYLTGAVANSSTANTTQIVFGTSSNNHVAISSNTDAVIINPTTGTTTGQIVLGVNATSSTFGNSVTFNGPANRFVSDTWANVGIKRAGTGGAWICFYPSNQETYFWNVGASGVSSNSTNFSFEYRGNGVKAYLTPSGTFSTVGDQVISSDINLKTNLQDVTYLVEDIAKTRAVTFDWKDGRGKSAGSIAQDWKHLIPELVHGEEGNMTLAYGQIAMLNTILLARRSEDHETRIKALELENAKLKEEIKRLKN